MISIEDLAIVIRDNIAAEEGPLGDLYLDCAAAVMAAIKSHQDRIVVSISNSQDVTNNTLSFDRAWALFGGA